MRADRFGNCFGGCLFKKISRTASDGLLELSCPTTHSKCSGPPPLLSSAIRQSAALTFITSQTKGFDKQEKRVN